MVGTRSTSGQGNDEKRPIQQTFSHAPLDPDLGDEPISTLEQRQDIIRSLIMTAMALSDADAAIAGERQT